MDAAAAATTSTFDSLIEKAGLLAAQFFGVYKAATFLWDSFKDALQAERSITRLNGAIAAFDPASKETGKTLHEWAQSLARFYGVADNEVLPVLQRLITVTGNVAEGQLLTKIATEAARAGLSDVGTAALSMGNMLIGLPVRATSSFGQMLKKAMIETGGDAGLALGRLQTQIETMVTGMQSNELEAARMAVTWGQVKEEIGGQFTSLTAGGQIAFEYIARFVSGLAMVVRDAIDTVVAAGQAMWQVVMLGYNAFAEGPKKAWAEYTEATNRIGSQLLDDLGKNLDKAGDVIDLFGKKLTETIDPKKNKELLDAIERLHKMMSKAKGEDETGAFMDERAKVWQEEEQGWLDHAEKLRKDKLAKLKEEQKDFEDFQHERAMAWQKADQAELDEAERVRKEKARKILADEKLAQQVAATQKARNIQATEGIVSSLGAMFNANKAAAVATAIIHAYQAAAGAAANQPGTYLEKIAAFVATLAEVWTAVKGIEGTEIGSGGRGGGYGAGGGYGGYGTPMAAWQGRPSETSGGGGSVSTSTTYGGAHVTQINALTSEHAAAMMTDFQHRSQPAARARARGTVGYQAQQGGSTR